MENNNSLIPENAELSSFDNLKKVGDKPEETETSAVETEAPVEDIEEPVETGYVNKSGTEHDNVMLFTISQDDVTNHLQNRILCTKVHCDYQRWDGAKDNAYVCMRVAIPADAVSQKVSAKVNNPVVQQSLEEANAGMFLAQEVYDRLTPYMYPKNMSNVNLNSEIVNYLNRIGLTAERYNEYINNFVEPCLSQDEKTGIRYFAMVLQADEIIQDMINKNPYNEKKWGKFEIIKVTGGEPVLDNFGRPTSFTPITWKCSINLSDSPSNGIYDISMNEIFKNAMVVK